VEVFGWVESVSSVMLGPVPSICNVAMGVTLADPRHKAEDDVEHGERLVINLLPMAVDAGIRQE
jgi:hypothetical protein